MTKRKDNKLSPEEELELFEKLEDELDIKACHERRNEPSIPWEQVKKELGL